MSTSTMPFPGEETQPAPPRRTVEAKVPAAGVTDIAWRPLYVVAATTALLAVLFVAQAVFVFLVWPPPTTVAGWFALLQRNGFLGLLELDLLLVASYILLIPVYIALFVALRRVSQSLMAIALAFNLVGAALILAANPSVGMLNLSHTYATATTEVQRVTALAAGQALMANWTGTPFVLGYLLGAFALLITGTVMLQSKDFSKLTAYLALAAGVLMLVPASAGTVGLIISLVSLVPFAVFLVLVARQLFQKADVTLLG
ncbi:MAG: hypothetical protein ACXWQR_13490 [Ktedonobacterales bacterium]